MTLMEAYRQSLRPAREGYRMLYHMKDLPKLPISSSNDVIKKFIERHKDRQIILVSDYEPSLRSDALIAAIGREEVEKLRKKMRKYNIRIIEISDYEEAMDWKDDMKSEWEQDTYDRRKSN